MRNIFISRSSLRSILSFILCLFCFSNSLFSQHVIRGQITGRDGLALPGATVSVKGTNNISTTDSAGYFMIMANPGNVIRFTFVGYHDYQVVLKNEAELNISLTGAIVNLDDVVVIGYGSAKKRDLTGSIGSVSEKNFNRGMLTTPDQLIQGKVPGVQIINNDGQPGGAATVKIRGNSALTGTGQPLYVVDDVPLDGRSLQGSNNPLNFINPDDIASIDILKDASATAIYGSRASYGVVIINTKKGHLGKTKLDVSFSVGGSSILKKIKVLNADQYREAIKYYGVSSSYDKGGNADGMDGILRSVWNRNYSIAGSGGNENGKYRFSVGLLNQDGIIINTNFKKYNADASANFKLLSDKKLGLDLNLISSQYIRDGAVISVGDKDMVIAALQWNPTESLRKTDGSPNIVPGGNTNPIALSEFLRDNLKVTTILGSISPYYKFSDWLEYKVLYSINYSTGISRSSTNQAIQYPGFPIGTATINDNELTTQQITQTLNFNKEISKGLSLNAVAGYENMKFKSKGFSVTGSGLDPAHGGNGFGDFGLDYTNYIQYSRADNRIVSSYIDPKSELQSFFGRTIFNYRDKYLLTTTLRADGSTKFGVNNKYGYFPSFAGAWNISNEKFFKVGFVNSLKIRGGWGKTGNQEFPPGSSQALYAFSDNGIVAQINNPNPDLKWQSDRQYNFGIDFSLLNNRISGTVDYFSKRTTNLLFPSSPVQPAPPGSTVRWLNLDGEIINKGWEVLINTSVINQKKIGVDLSVNATFLKNNVSGLPTPIFTGFVGGYVEIVQNEHPMNAFYTRKFLGLDKSGFSVYQDDATTFFYVGDPNPKTLLGISSTVRYNKFLLIANMNGSLGQDIYNATLMNILNVGGMNGGRNIALSVLQNSVRESFANPLQSPSSRFIQKGDYLKMSNLTVSYNIGDMGKALKSANVYITAQNLFIITKYPGFDPEVNFASYSVGSASVVPSLGIDFARYPSSRSIIFGIKFSLN